MALVRECGLDLCELYTNQVDRQSAESCRRAMEKHHVEASALFTSGPGRMVWDLLDGPDTLGLVPRTDPAARVVALKQASDFAKICGIPAFETHVGFIPENPRDPLYRETVNACREVVGHCRANGQTFLYHAGKETRLGEGRVDFPRFMKRLASRQWGASHHPALSRFGAKDTIWRPDCSWRRRASARIAFRS